MRARSLFFALIPLLACAAPGAAALAAPAAPTRVPVHVARHAAGAPVLFGLPLPKGALESPDHLRVLDAGGREVEAQVTEVSRWGAGRSLKWVWIFFFATDAERYTVEYGPGVRRRLPAAGLDGPLRVVNNPRPGGAVDVTAGPLHVTLRQGEGGFVQQALFDADGDGFDAGDLVVEQAGARGAFADLLDAQGLDASRAVLLRSTLERGSGPLHAVVRFEGEYRYGRPDQPAAPFVTRFHFYAGRAYVRVPHTWVYTGTPDRHRPLKGEYPHLATQARELDEGDPADPGWTQPEDQLQALGLGLQLALGPAPTVTTALHAGSWHAPGAARPVELVAPAGPVSLSQLGPRGAAGIAPESGPDARQGGFAAELRDGDRVRDAAERAPGWLDVRDAKRGVAVALPRFVEEHPKELAFDPGSGRLEAYFWSPRAGAMSFARDSSAPGAEGAVENWAQGLAKTSEAVLFFHRADLPPAELERTLRFLLEPPVAHAQGDWYGRSGVWGRFAGRADARPELERALDQKFEWMLFNQRWAPWWGVFDFGDLKQRYDNGRWDFWGHNEPAQDFELWVHFARTGDPRFFDAAQAMSRHTMDVDNTHWPAGPVYHGESNRAVDWWRSLEAPPASKWLGLGRRHAAQHWAHALSAHVWVAGWMADYYLAADHRALEVARQTADMHLRRLWGEHELTGRRLSLSTWNLAEVADATRDPRYLDELRARVLRSLRLQEEQGGELALERYGYSQVYSTHGLRLALDVLEDEAIAAALVRHARRERDVPSLNHWMESYLASLHALAVGYELSREPSFREELARRAALLRTDPLPRGFDGDWTQGALAAALRSAGHVPASPTFYRREFPAADRVRPPNWDPAHGLRFFGWTTGHGLPWALWAMAERP